MTMFVTNELVFFAEEERQEYIKRFVLDEDGCVDLSILMPDNWGTHKNAYNTLGPVLANERMIVFRFETAYTTPSDWMLGLAQKLEQHFYCNSLSDSQPICFTEIVRPIGIYLLKRETEGEETHDRLRRLGMHLGDPENPLNDIEKQMAIFEVR